MQESDASVPPEPPAIQWPPAPQAPPPPRFALAEPAVLALDQTLPPVDAGGQGAQAQAPPAPKVVPWDPKDDKAKARGRAVLRPTHEDNRRKAKKDRIHAAWRGMGIAAVLFVIGPSAGLPRYLLGFGLAAACGVLAREWRDSAGSWCLSMGLVGLALGLTCGGLLVPLFMGAFMALGWINGLLREFR